MKKKNAAPKRKGRRVRTPAKAGQDVRKYEILGLFFFAVGIVSLCGIFGWNVGMIGGTFAKALHYLFGVGAWCASLFFLVLGYQYMAYHQRGRFTLRFFGVVGVYASVLALYHHVAVLPGKEILPEHLAEGGGLLGGGIVFLLHKLFGMGGTAIVLIVATIAFLVLATKWSLATGISKTRETAKRGAAVAGSAIAVTYDRVAEASAQLEERVVTQVKEKAKNSFYNQEEELDDEALEPVDAVKIPTQAARVEEVPERMEIPAILPEIEQTENQSEELIFTAEEPAPVEEREGISFPIAYATAEAEEGAEEALEQEDFLWNSADVPFEEPRKEAATCVQETPLTVAEKMTEGVPAAKPYELPKVQNLLSKQVKQKNLALEMEIAENARTLEKTLEDFKVKAKIIHACHGPAVTRYELEPAPGVKVSKITNLSDDLALALAAFSVRIEPIPGKAAIGIEVPNRELEGVQLREVLEKPAFEEAKSKLTVGLGMDIGGQAIFADLAKMPHLLVAGATGSGKSVCINTLITSILFKATPEEVKFILIDPKMVELSGYNGIPHLMVPVVIDAKKAASVLNWAVQEMEKRYAKFAENTVRNMETYNAHFPEDKMSAVVIIIDELADLMMVAPHDVEDAICRLAQKARAAGIHLVLATQRPSVDVITGIIKANIPSRISFAVSSQIDSRTILDMGGAEKLLGKGDMLFYPIGAAKPHRVQGAFVSDEEVEGLLDFIRSQGQEMEANEEIIQFTEAAMKEKEEGAKGDAAKEDELLRDAVNLVLSTNQASTSSVQRRFRIGYTRAARLIDRMEELGIVGPNLGSKSREILMTSDDALALVDSVL